MKGMKYILTSVLAILCAAQMFAQVDRHDVRAGNRKFKKEDWREADISYRKALVKDSTSVAANYNLANTAYRQKNYDEAGKLLDRIKDSAPASSHVSDYWFNAGDVALAKKDYQAAVNAFKSALLANPSDLEAKENYIYAKKKLEDQQKNGGGGGQNDQNQNQDQNQNNQDSKDKQNDQQGIPPQIHTSETLPQWSHNFHPDPAPVSPFYKQKHHPIQIHPSCSQTDSSSFQNSYWHSAPAHSSHIRSPE